MSRLQIQSVVNFFSAVAIKSDELQPVVGSRSNNSRRIFLMDLPANEVVVPVLMPYAMALVGFEIIS